MQPGRAWSPRARRALALLWTGGEQERIGRLLAVGALVWAVYSGLHVALNGVVLDETVMPAQVIAGDVVYPPGHPNGVFYPRAFSLSYYLAAILWLVAPSAWAVSAVRNVLFLFCSTYVPFALTLVLTRRPAWGHVASVLTLSESACSFFGVYLLWVFPGFYSSGHIGMHLALLTVVLLVAGLWRAGGILLGILPAVHGAMALVVWPWSVCYLLARRGSGAARALRWTVLGLAVCAALAVAIHLRTGDARPAPPYDAPLDGALVRRLFTATTDPHRQPIRLASAAYLVNPAAFFALGGLLYWLSGHENQSRARADCAWLLLVGALAWAYVYGTRLVQALAGGLPGPVEMTMPGRFSNLPALYLFPLAVGVAAAILRRAAPGRVATGMGLMAGLLLVEAILLVVDRGAAFRQIAYGAWGLVLALACWTGPTPRAAPLLASAAVAAAAAFVAERGVPGLWSFLGTFAGCSAVLVFAGRSGRAIGRARDAVEIALAATCVLGALAALPGAHLASYTEAGSERVSPYERTLAAWLRDHAEPGDMILSPLWPPTLLQAKTGHPVLLDIMTLTNMAYMPEVAPAVGVLVRDVFGVDYTRPDELQRLVGPDGMLRPTSPVWLAAWERRTCEEWQRLAERYGFRWVLAPRRIPLALSPALPGPGWMLYAVPRDASCPERAAR